VSCIYQQSSFPPRRPQFPYFHTIKDEVFLRGVSLLRPGVPRVSAQGIPPVQTWSPSSFFLSKLLLAYSHRACLSRPETDLAPFPVCKHTYFLWLTNTVFSFCIYSGWMIFPRPSAREGPSVRACYPDFSLNRRRFSAFTKPRSPQSFPFQELWEFPFNGSRACKLLFRGAGCFCHAVLFVPPWCR